jgi:hypothetical protein
VDHNGWQHISLELTGGFSEVLYIQFMDGTDNDMLWNDSEEDGVVRRECEEAQGSDCGDGDIDTAW